MELATKLLFAIHRFERGEVRCDVKLLRDNFSSLLLVRFKKYFQLPFVTDFVNPLSNDHRRINITTAHPNATRNCFIYVTNILELFS